MPAVNLPPNSSAAIAGNTTNMDVYHPVMHNAGIIAPATQYRIAWGGATGLAQVPVTETHTLPSTATQTSPVQIGLIGPANKGRIWQIDNLSATQTIVIDAS